MNQFYYNMFNYKVLTMRNEGEQRTLKRHDPKTPHTLSKLLKCIHNSIYIRTAKSMNQFYYSMAKTIWALKHALFVFNYKVLTMHNEGEQRILKRHDPKTLQPVERKHSTWFLKLSTKNSLL